MYNSNTELQLYIQIVNFSKMRFIFLINFKMYEYELILKYSLNYKSI